MGSLAGSAVTGRRERGSAPLPGYEPLEGAVPVFHPRRMEDRAGETRNLLDTGAGTFSEILATGTPDLSVLLVADGDWEDAPREGERPYPPGLPYLTQSAEPPVLILPETLSPAFKPHTQATWPLVVWHELAHAFVLQRPVPRTPAWLREFVPQALAAAVARRTSVLSLHLGEIAPPPDLTVREFSGPADAEQQMAFQNALLGLGAAALVEFGEGFLRRLVHALWDQREVVSEARAEELLAGSLGSGGRVWLEGRPEFQGG